jgi:hypothetical protein
VPAVPASRGEVGDAAGDQVVDGDDLVAACQQRTGEM